MSKEFRPQRKSCGSLPTISKPNHPCSDYRRTSKFPIRHLAKTKPRSSMASALDNVLPGPANCTYECLH